MVAVAVAVVVARGRAMSDAGHSDGRRPLEYSDDEYAREVLQLDQGQTETTLDGDLEQQARELGIVIARAPSLEDGRRTQTALSESAETATTCHARTASSGSQGSTSTGLTSRHSSEPVNPRSTMPVVDRRPLQRRSRSFTDYEKYLAQYDAPDRTLPSTSLLPSPPPSEPAPSLFPVSTRKSYTGIRDGIRDKFRLRRSKTCQEDANSCICCRDIVKSSKRLHTLPCRHNYCNTCLHVLIGQATNDESRMPPKCCNQGIPGHIVRTVLSHEEQELFMKSVLQFSTPWEARIFCPNPACGEFIPRRTKIDPKHPFEVVCRKCQTRACSICKRAAHAFGQDCPADWELDAVLQMGERSGWRRCYKCRTLVELAQGCSHITCRCKAQFCYICGAVWDPTVGCPNYCNGEEELERRRLEEEARIAEEEAAKVAKEEADKLEAAEKLAAENRTSQSAELNALRARQINERDRFASFERKMRWIMWTRHGQAKVDILERYDELQTKMKERHLRTTAHLDDRQVAAEMDLRASLKQAERSVQIRLKHMEAYCDGVGRSASGANPARVVTERDLRELGQQYSLRDDLERLHQSKINVMRDKQAKQMEQLLLRHGEELEKLAARQSEELDVLEDSFGIEEDQFVSVFRERRERLRYRWQVTEEVERKKLENKMSVKFAPMAPVKWPEAIKPERARGLQAVAE